MLLHVTTTRLTETVSQINRLRAMNEDLTRQVLEMQDEVAAFLAPACRILQCPLQCNSSNTCMSSDNAISYANRNKVFENELSNKSYTFQTAFHYRS